MPCHALRQKAWPEISGWVLALCLLRIWWLYRQWRYIGVVRTESLSGMMIKQGITSRSVSEAQRVSVKAHLEQKPEHDQGQEPRARGCSRNQKPGMKQESGARSWSRKAEIRKQAGTRGQPGARERSWAVWQVARMLSKTEARTDIGCFRVEPSVGQNAGG